MCKNGCSGRDEADSTDADVVQASLHRVSRRPGYEGDDTEDQSD